MNWIDRNGSHTIYWICAVQNQRGLRYVLIISISWHLYRKTVINLISSTTVLHSFLNLQMEVPDEDTPQILPALLLTDRCSACRQRLCVILPYQANALYIVIIYPWHTICWALFFHSQKSFLSNGSVCHQDSEMAEQIMWGFLPGLFLGASPMQ